MEGEEGEEEEEEEENREEEEHKLAGNESHRGSKLHCGRLT